MPNWVYNELQLTNGSYKNFSKQLQAHNYMKSGFKIVKNDTSRCVFDLLKICDDFYSFYSKNAPPIDEMLERAKKGRFSFELHYEEPGNNIFGTVIYNHYDKSVITYDLDEDVFSRLTYNESGDAFVDGLPIQSDTEWLEEQLEILINNK